MLRWACVSMLIVAAGCSDVPELTFADAGALDGGAGDAAGVPCGAFTCIDHQNPGQCPNCGQCTLGCGSNDKVCCFDNSGALSCRQNVASCH